MRIAFVTEYVTPDVGYIDNLLPREFGRLGHDSHCITTHLPHNFWSLNENVYSTQQSLSELCSKRAETQQLEHHVLHRLPVRLLMGRAVISGLGQTLRTIAPDLIIVRGLALWALGQVALYRAFNDCIVFSSTGMAYSHFSETIRKSHRLSFPRVKNLCVRVMPGRLYSYFTDYCVASTDDCARLATDFYGIPKRKTKVISLGVDTDVFHPLQGEEDQRRRAQLREKLGITADEIVCIFTGRLSRRKLIGLLAEVVRDLREAGHPYRALFIGAGNEGMAVRSMPGSILLPFMKWSDLAPYYRAADIAVWPCSITTSMLDAAASGLPIIMSDQEQATERWAGNGLTYREGDGDALRGALLQLQSEPLRHRLGQAGVDKMRRLYRWKTIAQQFINLFEESVQKKHTIIREQRSRS